MNHNDSTSADGRTEFWASFVESHLQNFVHANEADDVGPSHSHVTLIADSGDTMPDAQAIQVTPFRAIVHLCP